MFPVRYTFQQDSTNRPFVFDIPFDYPNLVEWSSGTFEVGITAVLSSVYQTYWYFESRVDMTIAKWNAASSAYAYSGTGRYVLDKDSLFGPNRPFTTVSGQNVVKMIGQGFESSFIVSYLIFHKVQLTGPVQTGFGVVRTRARDHIMGPYSDNIADPTYNVAITDPKAIRIYGFEAYHVNIGDFYSDVLEISTTDGVSTIGLHDADENANYAYTSEFYATYLTPTVPAGCPTGCNCESGTVCSSCKAFHVSAPVTLGGFAYCPCLAGFFWEADATCKPCPRASYCDTCEYNNYNEFYCTACKCR